MRAWPLLVLPALLLTACATVSPWATPEPTPAPKPVPELLARADTALVDGQYVDARALYREFHDRFPKHAAAGRAGASSALLDRILALEDRVGRLQRELEARSAEVDELRARLTAHRAEERTPVRNDPKADSAQVVRLRRELQAREAEIRGLKNDLERLRAIDLTVRPGRTP